MAENMAICKHNVVGGCKRDDGCVYCDHGDTVKHRCFQCKAMSVCSFCAHCNTDGCDYVMDRGD